MFMKQGIICLLAGAGIAGCGGPLPGPGEGAPAKDPGAQVATRQAPLFGAGNGQNNVPYLVQFNNGQPAYCDVKTHTTCQGQEVIGVTTVNPGASPAWLDDGTATINLPGNPPDPPFQFDYYGASIVSVTVSTNGFISLSGADAGFSNVDVFDARATPNLIAGWWDDMLFRSAGDFVIAQVGRAPTRQFVVQWSNWQTYGEQNPDCGTRSVRNMQIVLNEKSTSNPRSNQIDVLYGPATAGSCNYDSATVGLTGPAGGASPSVRTLECDCTGRAGSCQPGCALPNFPSGLSHTYGPPPPRYAQSAAGPPYQPLAGAVSQCGLPDLDDGAAFISFPAGFTFSYYDQPQSSLWVSANGYLTFGAAPPAGTLNFNNVDIPDPNPPNNRIAAGWDDLVLPTANDCLFQIRPAGDGVPELVIQWTNATHFASADGAQVNVQVHLRQDNTIQIAYGPITIPNSPSFSATIGLEDASPSSTSNYVRAATCSPTCSGANWPTGTLQLRPPRWADIYPRYFAAADLAAGTLHCGACHSTFQSPLGTVADQPTTYARLFQGIDLVNEASAPTPTSCGAFGMFTDYVPVGPLLQPLITSHPLDGRVDPLSAPAMGYPDGALGNLADVHQSPIVFVNSAAGMPFDCRPDRMGWDPQQAEWTRRDLLRWFAGAIGQSCPDGSCD